MKSRSWIISFKSDRDVIVIVTSWIILASQLQEVIEGTLVNFLSHRKTRSNNNDVAIVRNSFKSDRDVIVIVFSWCVSYDITTKNHLFRTNGNKLRDFFACLFLKHIVSRGFKLRNQCIVFKNINYFSKYI
jgi:hypothetical protein